MEDLIKKYKGKKLSPDKYAKASNEVKKAIEELEQLEFDPEGEDHVLLKWGTLKSWKFTSKKGQELFKKYQELGMSMGAAQQDDSQEQKEIICQLIDECNGFIQEDWEGKYLTKAQAKKYVMGYK